MKILSLILLLLIPANFGQSNDKQAYWFCTQIGFVGKTPTLVFTDVHANMKDIPHSDKASIFEKMVKEEVRQFQEQYDGVCIDYRLQQNAQSHLKKAIARATRLGFKIIKIKPNFREKYEKGH